MNIRPELFDDVAEQFEKLEQPLNLTWMQGRRVTPEEVQALSQKIALVLRGFRALHPQDQIKFVAGGLFKPADTTDQPADTLLGQRQAGASSNHETTKS